MKDYKELGENKDLPVTIIWGKDDVVCPIKNSDELVRDAIPHARLVLYENAGHAVLYEKAGEVAREIDAILSVATG